MVRRLSGELRYALQDVGFLHRRYSSLQEYEKEKQLEAARKAMEELEYQYMPALEYCNWLPANTAKERTMKKKVQETYPHCCFNHRVGLPRTVFEDRETGQIWESDPIEIYDYERKVIEDYEKARYYGLNKVRGSGITEILPVRHMAYKYAVANTIIDRKCLMMAGINKGVAIGILYRIVQLLAPFPFLYRQLPNPENPEVLKLRTGGLIIALPSAKNAARGLANVGDVMLDESAFWDMEDDEPVLKAMEPFVAKGRSHLAVFSTPNGQRGFFWTKLFDPELRKTKYDLYILTMKEVENVPIPVIDVEEAKRLKDEDPDLYAQEFGNEFLLPSTSVFGDKFARGEKIAEF